MKLDLLHLIHNMLARDGEERPVRKETATELGGFIGELKERLGAFETAVAALMVFTRTPHIRAYLAVMDPKALEQAETALGVPEFLRGALKGPLPDLRDMQVVKEALEQFLREYNKAEEVESLHKVREAKRAKALLERIEVGMTPLAAREDKINAEEDAKEERKAAMMDEAREREFRQFAGFDGTGWLED